jgi:hypothetical protein
MGRHNMDPEARSYLRGKRYNRDKRQGERTDLTSATNGQKSDTTARDLAETYGVSAHTIRNDGAFAEAVDTLEEQMRKDLRDVVTQRQGRTGEARSPKGRVTRAGRAVKERRVTPLPFIQRAEWKDHQVIGEGVWLSDRTRGRESAVLPQGPIGA